MLRSSHGDCSAFMPPEAEVELSMLQSCRGGEQAPGYPETVPALGSSFLPEALFLMQALLS